MSPKDWKPVQRKTSKRKVISRIETNRSVVDGPGAILRGLSSGSALRHRVVNRVANGPTFHAGFRRSGPGSLSVLPESNAECEPKRSSLQVNLDTATLNAQIRQKQDACLHAFRES